MKFLIAICCLVVSASAATLQLSSLIQTCSKSDPKLDECATKAANEMIPLLVKGIPEYGVESIDPYHLDFMSVDQSDKPVGMKLNITDNIHEGMRLAKVTGVRLSELDKGYYEVDVHFPHYTVNGICNFGGQILLLPIKGHGVCNMSAIEMDVTLKIWLKEVERDGKKYYEYKDVKTNSIAKGGKVKIEGLFDGNKELGDTMNKFINENAVEILKDLKPTMEVTWATIFGALLQKMANNIPVDEYFKP